MPTAYFGGGELEAVEARLRDAERWLDTTADTHARLESPAAGMVVVDEEEFRRLPGMIALLRAAAGPGPGRYARDREKRCDGCSISHLRTTI